MDRKNVRAVAIFSAVSFDSVQVKGWATRMLATLLCLGGALLLTASRIETTRLRYDLNEIHLQRQAIAAEVEQLSLEISNLSRHQRIERLAKARGLIHPRPEQVIGLND